jgi:hypothetical protein
MQLSVSLFTSLEKVIMKKKLPCLIYLISITTLFSSNLLASHLDGYNISFKHISGPTYEFKLEFFNSILSFPGVPDSLKMEGYSTCGGGFLFYLNSMGNTSYVPTNCTQSSLPLKHTTYRKNITFTNNGCSDFEVKLSNNIYVNGSVTNANSSNGDNKKVIVSGVGLFSNNSPKFVGEIERFANINELKSYNLGTEEIDGDSVVYKIVQHSRQFNQGYTVNAPFGINQPFNLNSSTGIINATINNIGFYLANIEVEEYRNGNLISKVHREWITHAVQTLPNQLSISGINYSNKYDTTICAGDSIGFLFQAIDSISPINPTLVNNFHGATTYTSNGMSYFKWIPNNSININIPYNFYINVKDNDCNSLTKVFSVYFLSCIPISLVEEIQPINLNLFPNPTAEFITIQNRITNNEKIEIRDLTGRIVQQDILNQNKIDVSQLENGIYFITLIGKENYLTQKFVVRK